MKEKLRRLMEFDSEAGYYLGNQKTASTKLAESLKEVSSQMRGISKKTSKTLTRKLRRIMVDHCKTEPPDDPNGAVLKDAMGNYMFTKTAELACSEALEDAKENFPDEEYVTITPSMCLLIPPDLSDQQLNAFVGFVMTPEQAEDVRKKRAAEAEGEAAEAAAADAEKLEAAPTNGKIPLNQVTQPKGETNAESQNALP